MVTEGDGDVGRKQTGNRRTKKRTAAAARFRRVCDRPPRTDHRIDVIDLADDQPVIGSDGSSGASVCGRAEERCVAW